MSLEILAKPINKQKNRTKKTTKTYTVGSLFAGIGGICQGFINSGFKIQWANEIDKQACITYRANFKHDLIEADITKLDPKETPKIDILAGGFPCQAFSVAGYRKGFTDTRGTLFFDILRFIDFHKPSVIFLENVKNIVGHDKGNTLKTILHELEEVRGYHCKYTVINTAEYGNIPQNRERFYLVAFNDKKLCDEFEFPKPIALTTKIKDYIFHCDDERFFYTNNKIYPLLQEQMTNPNTLYQWRRIYVRENKSNLCPTLTANMGTGGHNVPLILAENGIRKLTPRECASLQGFKDKFVLPDTLPNSALYKQIGNSVSIPVIERIAKNIYKILNGVDK
ncbi:MAG: DNA cytosine methyltransferase [Brevinema sp.]